MEIARLRYYVLSAVSGGLWSIAAFFFAYRALGNGIWGGMLVSPLIGLLVGVVTWPIRQVPPKWLAAVSAATVYGSGILFGLAVGICNILIGPSGRNPWQVMFEPVAAILWSLTAFGFIILFLPAAYFNFWLINRSLEK